MQIGTLLQWWQFLLASRFIIAGHAQVNVTLQSTASEIVYTPPSCNSRAETCESAWQVIPSPDAPGSYVTSTSGPTSGSGVLIPQLFLTFRGTGLNIRTSTLSTATANVTLSTEDPAISITTQVDTAAGLITVVGLPDDRSTTLAMTFIATTDKSTRLDIANLTIVTPNNDTSPFSSTTLPSSTAVPSFTPIVSASPTSHETKEVRGGDIAAEVLGAILGVVLGGLGVAGVSYYRRRRRQAGESNA